MKTVLNINGKRMTFDGDADMPLLWVLRDELALTGTKYGCGIGMCGACTVHLDGKPVRSCATPVAEVGHRRVTTIEGLSANGDHPVQRAWRECRVPQCGYCQSGQQMTAAAFIGTNSSPTQEQVGEAMAGNLCRCGTYARIDQAVQLAARYVRVEAGK